MEDYHKWIQYSNEDREDGHRVPKTDEEWTPKDKKKVEMNAKAINLMHCVISFEEYQKVLRRKVQRKSGVSFNLLMKEPSKLNKPRHICLCVSMNCFA